MNASDFPTCPHLSIVGTCSVAGKIAGLENVATNSSACYYCLQSDSKQSANRATVAMAVHALVASGQTGLADGLLHENRTLFLDDAGSRERLEAIANGRGVGSQLWRLLESLGVKHNPTCPCLGFAEQMNAWGVAGCREHRAEIVDHMRTHAKSYGWGTVATAAAKAVLTGVAFRLSILDPYGSLVDEAIRRAEAVPAAAPIDILLPLGPGSRYGNAEVRMALRSIARHAVGVRRVVVIGAIPPFLRSTDTVECVPLREFKCNKASRISQKVLWAFQNLDLTPTIAFWNDDYLLLRDQDVRTIPNHCHGQLWRKPKSHWNRLLNHTGVVLRDAGFSSRHFDIHIPILYEREKWLAIADWWERSRRDALGLVAKSVYGNIHCQGTEARANDAKLQSNWQTRLDDLQRYRWIVSYGDAALDNGFVTWMQGRFSTPTNAEIQPSVKTQKRSGRRRRRKECKKC